jgi:hypothetical protein
MDLATIPKPKPTKPGEPNEADGIMISPEDEAAELRKDLGL